MPDFSFVLWGLLIVAAVVVMLIKKDFRDSAVATMNFDSENVPPFFCRLSAIFDSGFKVSDVHAIQLMIEQMNEDNEVKDLGCYSVQFQGKKMRIRIKAEIHLDLEDNTKEVVLSLSSRPELVLAINRVMRRFAEEYEN
ncbi:MAG: hypothetical protein ACQEXB_09590 [Bacillota bacterium]